MRKAEIIIWLLILTSFGIAAYYYPQIPAKAAVHWDINGNVNGCMDKFKGIFGYPSINIMMAAIFFLITRIEKVKAEKNFVFYFDIFSVVFIFLLSLVHVKVTLFNVGRDIIPNSVLISFFNIFLFLTVAGSLVFAVIRAMNPPDRN